MCVRISTYAPITMLAPFQRTFHYRQVYYSLGENNTAQEKGDIKKGLTTEPRTRDLRSNTEFQPRELRNRLRSLVPHRRLYAHF